MHSLQAYLNVSRTFGERCDNRICLAHITTSHICCQQFNNPFLVSPFPLLSHCGNQRRKDCGKCSEAVQVTFTSLYPIGLQGNCIGVGVKVPEMKTIWITRQQISRYL